MEATTLIIAIIGAITGILSLVIQFVEYSKSNVNIIMKIDERRTFYNEIENKNQTVYRCKNMGVISLKISNCSSLPITIDEAKIIHNDNNILYLNSKKTINCGKVMDDKRILSINLYEQANLPLRIECYDTVYLSFIFPFIDNIIESESEFVLITPRRNYKEKFCFKSLNDVI